MHYTSLNIIIGDAKENWGLFVALNSNQHSGFLGVKYLRLEIDSPEFRAPFPHVPNMGQQYRNKLRSFLKKLKWNVQELQMVPVK